MVVIAEVKVENNYIRPLTLSNNNGDCNDMQDLNLRLVSVIAINLCAIP